MNEISKWQKDLATACNIKYPAQNWTTDEYIFDLIRQVGDVSKAKQLADGTYIDKNKKNDEDWTISHRTAALIASALIFAENKNVDWQSRMHEVLKWYQNKDAKTSG
jgi:hypothetical protein